MPLLLLCGLISLGLSFGMLLVLTTTLLITGFFDILRAVKAHLDHCLLFFLEFLGVDTFAGASDVLDCRRWGLIIGGLACLQGVNLVGSRLSFFDACVLVLAFLAHTLPFSL